jgi:hypothetical protein
MRHLFGKQLAGAARVRQRLIPPETRRTQGDVLTMHKSEHVKLEGQEEMGIEGHHINLFHFGI